MYDVQLGLTFAQSFAYLAYNVTAVAQSDVNGYGPAYLLNGLSNQGYWYQVGVSWDWPSGNGGYYSGFAMNYEVFDSNGNSVFPASGGGGLTTLSGTVNSGDIVLLSLSFSGGNVVMYAFDWNTSAIAQETYAAHGAATFVGQTSGPDNGNGLFTGLMMEWYHSTSSIGIISPVIFTNSTTALSSGWLWADDWNPKTGAAVFSDHNHFTFSNPSQLQYFNTNGTTMAADGYEFIAGTASTVSPVSEVPLTFSFSVVGGGGGYSPPILTYVSNGSTLTATLGSTPQSYSLDVGSTWSVNASLPGSGPTERWDTAETTSGTVSGATTTAFTYYHQYYETVSYSVSGGGSPPAPSFSYYQLGSSKAVAVTGSATGYWADSSQAWSVAPNPLGGSSSSEQWATAQTTSGTVSSSWTTVFGYNNQYYLNVTSTYGSPTGTGWYNASSTANFQISTPQAGITGVQYAYPVWTGAGAGSYSGSSNSTSVTMNNPINESASTWTTQYYYAVTSLYGSPSGAGWYNSGTTAASSVTSPTSGGTGTQYVVMTYAGTGSAPSGSGSSNSFTILQASSTTYSWKTQYYVAVNSEYGTVAGAGWYDSGSTASFSPSPSSVSAGFLTSHVFTGWSGDSTAKGSTASVIVDSPKTITATWAVDSTQLYLAVAGIAIAIVAVLCVVLVRRRRQPSPSQPIRRSKPTSKVGG